jgi:predicted nucleic acid-binding protein
MVLVDTSIWVRALSGQQPFRDRLDELLADECVIGHELVYGELLYWRLRRTRKSVG